MNRRILALTLLLGFASLPAGATTDLEMAVDGISWETIGGDVVFTLTFVNPGLDASDPVPGALYPKEFGAFLAMGNTGYPFEIPSIPAEGALDIMVSVPLMDLPASAAEELPWDPNGYPIPCDADDHWDGSVDVTWAGPTGGGMAEYSHATIQVCSGFGTSYLHISTDAPSSMDFIMLGSYCGLNPWLKNEDFSTVSDPLPADWSGWIKITADWNAVPGDYCPRAVRLTSGGESYDVHFTVEVCDCSVIPNEDTSWSNIKTLYR